jgi:predicted nucleotidyltransferase
MNTFNLLRQRKPEILAIAALHGVVNVRVFGSVARGEDSESSDIDLLVSMDKNRSLYDLIGFQQDIEKTLGRSADVLTENGINRYLRDQILGEATAL